MSLRAPCPHGWYEPHTITGTGGQHCKGGHAATDEELLEECRRRGLLDTQPGASKCP